MRSLLLPSAGFVGFFCSCFIGAPSVSAAETTLQRVPPITIEQIAAYPENVARHQAGARIESAFNVNALLSADPNAGINVAAGRTTLLVSLSKIENVQSVSCLSRGAKGNLTISTSNSKLALTSDQWRDAAKCELGADALDAKIGPVEAKYVRLTFELSEPGRVSSLGVYSTPTVAAFTMPRTTDRSFGLVNYSLTNVHAKARTLYVSSGEDLKHANWMLDDQPATAYSFGPADSAPTAVIDLGRVTNLRRISAIYSARKGSLDFFVADTLPVAGGSTPFHLNDAALAKMKSVGKVNDGTGRAAIDFPTTNGRYVVLRWTPLTQEDAAFSVAEVAAFGGNKEDGLLAGNSDENTSDGKTVVDSKDLGDGKDIPAEGEKADPPAEGPQSALPPPPPFTFIPELIPTSP